MRQKLKIVTGLQDRQALLEESTIDRLLPVLCRRARRLIKDREICERMRPAFRRFVQNAISYFQDSGELDEYTMTNFMTALLTADSHDGVEDFSTFIRALNPTEPDAGKYFIIGRAGSIHDPACPLKALEQGDVCFSDGAWELYQLELAA